MTHHPSEFLWAGFGNLIIYPMIVGLMSFRVEKDLLLTRFCEDERMNKKQRVVVPKQSNQRACVRCVRAQRITRATTTKQQT